MLRNAVHCPRAVTLSGPCSGVEHATLRIGSAVVWLVQHWGVAGMPGFEPGLPLPAEVEQQPRGAAAVGRRRGDRPQRCLTDQNSRQTAGR